ncbi:hypothetical protein [Blastochloris sulfoviridis]|uniref:Secreted protein n=1 Tax=Blastochloris sulfoviridis TaxID=50712 RepID=A0A5M6I0S1_9HYPH|nr:hypothetical protein [Blastochloris sulfoviridis]KAA5601773.1 hypothetical protein F1193_08640 [Blastochloris sulfoviridis]
MLIIDMTMLIRAGALAMVALAAVFLTTTTARTDHAAALAEAPAPAMVGEAATSSGLVFFARPTSAGRHLDVRAPNSASRSWRPARGRRRGCSRWGTGCATPTDAKSIALTPEVD